MDSGVAPHLGGALGKFCPGLLLAAPWRLRWPAFLAPQAAPPCGRSCAEAAARSLKHAFYFISCICPYCSMPAGRPSRGCGSCINCSDPKLKKKFGCMVTPRKKRPKRNESEALAWDLTSAEFRSPSETKTVALSVRSTVVTGSGKKAKPAEKQTPDPNYQSQLKQLEARMKEQLKQIQHQVTGECHPVPTSLLVTAVSVAALASECPETRARQLTEINFGSADVGAGYGSTSAGQKQKRADSAEISEQITEQVGNDSVKHLELLEHMASKFKTNNPEVEPDKHVAAALEVALLQYPNPPPNIPLHTQYARIHMYI